MAIYIYIYLGVLLKLIYDKVTQLVTDYFSAISSDEDEEFFELPPENCQTSSIHSDIDGTLLSHHGNHSKSKTSGKNYFQLSIICK